MALLLVPFRDSASLADATLQFLTDAAFRERTRLAAFEYARKMSCPTVGRQSLELFSRLVPGAVRQGPRPKPVLRGPLATAASPGRPGTLVEG